MFYLESLTPAIPINTLLSRELGLLVVTIAKVNLEASQPL